MKFKFQFKSLRYLKTFLLNFFISTGNLIEILTRTFTLFSIQLFELNFYKEPNFCKILHSIFGTFFVKIKNIHKKQVKNITYSFY